MGEAEPTHNNAAGTLMVCDAGGRVQAVSQGASIADLAETVATQKHFSEIFGRDSQITHWLTEQMNEARKRGEMTAEFRARNGAGELVVRLSSLKQNGELYGFALHLLPSGSSACAQLNEGDSIVTRQQWHDIKNHLGGLKLYATFLKRKLPVGDDQQTVEKMLSGIDGLIEHLAKIRRGDVQ